MSGIPRDVEFRSERSLDRARIGRVVSEAFGDETVSMLIERLRRSEDWIDGLSFVAEAENDVVAHILFTRGLLDAPRRLVDVLVLSPVSVTPAEQGRGIGSGLMRFGLRQVESRSEPLVFVEGSARFYERFGFEPAGELGFRRPSLRIPPQAFQVVRLAGYEDWMTGTLVYSRVFWDLDAVGLRDADS